MAKKQPLYPHIPKSRMAAEKTKTPTPRETFGMKVHLKLSSGEEGYARNMTEIHYGYHTRALPERLVAFESNIHGTGFTHSIGEVIEFEATMEGEIAKEFWEPIRRGRYA